ncbi:hypothetical protein GF348_20025, partial [candidate division KSB3 bacterium]|nr:hypothetical protein [candidate division KSB3 bacterium]
PFIYNHTLDFSKIGKSGLYYLEIYQESKSHPFKVEDNPYTGLIDLFLRFMRAARCGNTEPDFHGPCHVHDATNVNLDVTGGWHDAGDYIKFSKKESYVTYLLLLTYAENVKDADQFSDLNSNGLPDVIDEAKIGLDYLLKLYPDEDTFVYRVGDLKWDHRQGMRMPESDKLAKNQRPALIGFDRNNLAKYAYTMALGANVFKDFPQFGKEVETYLQLAKRAYEKAMQIEDDHFDKLCLAATELYRVTEKPEYLIDARKFNDRLTRSDGGSYDTNVNFAHARLAPYYDKARLKLRASLALMLSTSNQRAFGYTTRRYLWGSLYRCLSGGSAAWLYESLTGDPTYDVVNRRIRDFTLGVNPWGVCFVSGVGTVYPKSTHGNLPFVLEKKGVLKEAALPGSVALGPVDRSYWEKEWHHLVPTARDDIYAEFQPPDCLYHDHPHDFVTNEPCIYGSAEAILFFSQFMRSRSQ